MTYEYYFIIYHVGKKNLIHSHTGSITDNLLANRIDSKNKEII